MEFGWGMPMPMNFPDSRHRFPPPQFHGAIPPPWAGPPVQPWSQPNHNNNGYRPQRNNNNKRQRKEPAFIDYCDVCDRGFKNVAKKEEHFRQHVKCDKQGCNFEAHFKIVAIHKQNLHGPNGPKIKLDTPEDIEKWRNERKRKYPTRENVELKIKTVNDRNKHGNVLQDKNFGKMRQRKNKKTFNNQNKVIEEEKAPITQHSIGNSQNTAPVNLLLSNESNTLEDNVSSDESDSKLPSVNANVSLGLSSLMQSYASDSEEEATTIIPEKHNDTSVQNKAVAKIEVNTISTQENCSVDPSICDNSSDKNFDEIPSKRRRLSEKNKKNSNNHLQKKKPTLLEMLLAPDIRRERNHILQCVRFVVRNNFFDNETTCS